eukprot:62504_1
MGSCIRSSSTTSRIDEDVIAEFRSLLTNPKKDKIKVDDLSNQMKSKGFDERLIYNFSTLVDKDHDNKISLAEFNDKFGYWIICPFGIISCNKKKHRIRNQW